MSTLKKPSIKISTPERPYGLSGSVMMYLPIDPKANGTKHGDVIAELDDGYLIVFNKNMFTTTVSYIPKDKVQL